MKRTWAMGLGVLLVAVASGCTTGMKARANGLSGYYEMQKDGRYYVAGTPEGMLQLREHGELGVSLARVGEGPGRATVVLEVDKKGTATSDTLWRLFQSRHNL